MTIYLNIETQEYPRHDGDLELLGWKLGEPLPENWVEVEYVEPPIYQDGETLERLSPAFIDGKWQMSWKVRLLTPDEILAIAEYEKRKAEEEARFTS